MFQVDLCLLNIYTQHLEAIQDKKLFRMNICKYSLNTTL